MATKAKVQNEVVNPGRVAKPSTRKLLVESVPIEKQAAVDDYTTKQAVIDETIKPLTIPYILAPIDDYLLGLSKRLLIKVPISEKPSPLGQPEIWASERQALCETLPYYQAYHGAAYASGGVFYSANLDSNGHDRDFMDGDVIITRGGGGMDKDDETGEMVIVHDHKENAHSRAMRNNIVSEIPLVILCGNKNTNAPSKMPHRYSVLDWFKPTDIWYEKTKNRRPRGKRCQVFVTMKYRFEKLVAEKESWWAPADKQPIVGLGGLELPRSETCTSCYAAHKQVYLEGWMCLSLDCDKHWVLPDGTPGEDVNLNLDPRFLKQKTTWTHEAEPYELRPELPAPSTMWEMFVSRRDERLDLLK
ncbi:hypothetical protein MBLNU459_g0519t3 [Dothideomycetes sp. NU459]